MNRQEYVRDLGQRLSVLPLSLEDTGDAMRFYEEYFDEAGPEREQDVIAELGSPAYVAAQIALKLSASATPLTERKPVKPRREHTVESGRERILQGKIVWAIILGVLAAPVALPLAACVAVAMLCLLLAALMIPLAFGIGGIACIVTGFMTEIYAALNIATLGFPTTLYMFGMGLFSIGAGGLLARLGWWIGKVCLTGASKVASRFFNHEKETPVPVFETAAFTEHPEGSN
jgi:uncharacterized membrane protein